MLMAANGKNIPQQTKLISDDRYWHLMDIQSDVTRATSGHGYVLFSHEKPPDSTRIECAVTRFQNSTEVT